MWPFWCVGPVTDCIKLRESIRHENSLTRGFEWQQTWILKSPKIKRLSERETREAKKSENSWMKSLLNFGGKFNNKKKITYVDQLIN